MVAKKKKLPRNEVRVNVLHILDCYNNSCARWKDRKKHGGGALGSSGSPLCLENTPELFGELRVLSQNLIGGEEKRKKREDRVELGEDVKSDEGEKWIVTKQSLRLGLMETKKRDKTKTKQINSTLLSFAYICTKEGRLLHNTIYLYNIYHVTAVHLPSNHSHRDIRSKTKDIHIHIYLKIKKNKRKKIYGHAYSINIAKYR